jgi:hypothetical protein
MPSISGDEVKLSSNCVAVPIVFVSSPIAAVARKLSAPSVVVGRRVEVSIGVAVDALTWFPLLELHEGGFMNVVPVLMEEVLFAWPERRRWSCKLSKALRDVWVGLGCGAGSWRRGAATGYRRGCGLSGNVSCKEDMFIGELGSFIVVFRVLLVDV